MSTTSLSTVAAIGRGLRGAMQWRLWVLWALVTLACAVLAALPAWGWLGAAFDHSVHADAIANGEAPALFADAVMSRNAPLPLLGGSAMAGALLMLMASPLLAGATIAAIRSPARLGFGDLLRGAIGEYGPMLRMLLWSALPLGAAIAVGAAIAGANADAHEHAVLASELDTGRRIALVVGGLLFVLAHASLEAGRGWIAADGRLRSVLKAWWRGVKLLLRRPVAVLAAWLATSLVGFALFALAMSLRHHVDGPGMGALLLGLGVSSLAAMALAWGRIARLYAMAALATDMHARR